MLPQGRLTRTLARELPSRLTSSATPEFGTTNFYYTTGTGGLCAADPNAVCRRTDARSITTTYGYDALNRLTSKTYSDSTPAAYYYYDESNPTINGVTYNLSNTKGRLSHATAANGLAETIYNYDMMGRIGNFWQCTPWGCPTASVWSTGYAYDSAGHLTSWTHPAGFTLTNALGSDGRISQITSSLSNSTNPATLATITYAPQGALSTLTNGCVGTGCTQGVETYIYNNRLQPVVIELGTSPSNPAADSCWVYNYYSATPPASCAAPASGTNNNGNVQSELYQDSVNPLNHTRAYGYDALNRLTSVTTKNLPARR